MLALALLAGGLMICMPRVASAATCRVTAGALNFGNYNPLRATALNRTGQLTIRCSGTGAFSVALSTGDSGSFTLRYMLSGATGNPLGYNLYTDAARSIIWGDGSGGSQTVSRAFNNNRVRLNVYGRIPAQENVAAGNYRDSITASITF